MAARPRRTVKATSTIKKEAHHELNAIRKRLNDIATEFAGCNALETFTNDAFTRVDHNDQCVQCVDFDMAASNPCWKIMNSWRCDWREAGFILLP